jgi:hypothetical protein
MKKHTKKLSLDRETLVSLQSDALGAVNGGAARTLSWGCEPTGGGGGTKTQFLCMPPPTQL